MRVYAQLYMPNHVGFKVVLFPLQKWKTASSTGCWCTSTRPEACMAVTSRASLVRTSFTCLSSRNAHVSHSCCVLVLLDEGEYFLKGQ